MALLASVGESQLLDGREAGAEAARRAFDRLGSGPGKLGFVIASQDYPVEEVVSGVLALLGDTPLLGFSTSAVLSAEGQNPRSVVVGLLSSGDIQARADWWPSSLEGSQAGAAPPSVRKMLQNLHPDDSMGTLLVVYDGLSTNADKLVEAVQAGLKQDAEEGSPGPQLIGCLSGGDLHHQRSYQIGGRQSGAGGLAGAFLSGKITIGLGAATGWKAAGPFFKVTKAGGAGIRGLDGQAPAEVYAQLLGHTARDWCLPPLNELVRLYALGLHIQGKDAPQKPVQVRSPLRMENDGSLLLNAVIKEKSAAHLMIGSIENCVQAAEDAARQALDALAHSNLAHTDLALTELGQYGLAQRQAQNHPVLALLLVDAAWQMLMEASPGEEVKAVQKILGKDVPIIGGYTFGQIAPLTAGTGTELLNQHLLLILFGETG
jgi:hypothetical protein